MLNRDDIAHAARYTDALAEEIGFQEVLKRYGIDKDGLLYMSEQRAMRMCMVVEGRERELAQRQAEGKPFRPNLTPESKVLFASFQSAWVDGFTSGVVARHDTSHDVPGIDTNTTKED